MIPFLAWDSKNIFRKRNFVKVGGVRILAEDCAKSFGGMGQGGGWRGRLGEDEQSEEFIREFSVIIKLLESAIPLLCHTESESLLLQLYFSNMVNWISPKVLNKKYLTT